MTGRCSLVELCDLGFHACSSLKSIACIQNVGLFQSWLEESRLSLGPAAPLPFIKKMIAMGKDQHF